jgi:DNA-binding CsgD family transcriptional regulator/pimeloyl-ACP methyl ester carboxylesterase
MDAPPIQYCRTEDGVNIAYWTLGEGPTALVLSLPTLSHLELEWGIASFRSFYQTLARRFRVIRYSVRNARLSDQGVADLSSDAFDSDAIAVLDACDANPTALISFMAARTATNLAVRHPNRVSALILVNGLRLTNIALAESSMAQFEFDYDGFLDGFVRTLDAGGDENSQLRALIDASVDRNDRVRMLRALITDLDAPDAFPEVQAPTLVIYSRGRGGGPLEENARAAASGIPNARLLGRPSEQIALKDVLNPEVATIAGDFIDESIGRTVEDQADDVQAPDPVATGLTNREIEVVRLVSQGLSNAAIGEQLVISSATVARHVSNILNKTGLSNRVELTRFAGESGLL